MKFEETTIYRSYSIQLEKFISFYKNMDKDLKMTVGRTVIEKMTDCIIDMSSSYFSKDIGDKVKYGKSVLLKTNQCEVLVKTLFDLKALSVKQMVVLSFNFGQIKEQLNKWLGSLDADGHKA